MKWVNKSCVRFRINPCMLCDVYFTDRINRMISHSHHVVHWDTRRGVFLKCSWFYQVFCFWFDHCAVCKTIPYWLGKLMAMGFDCCALSSWLKLVFGQSLWNTHTINTPTNFNGNFFFHQLGEVRDHLLSFNLCFIHLFSSIRYWTINRTVLYSFRSFSIFFKFILFRHSLHTLWPNKNVNRFLLFRFCFCSRCFLL